MQTLVLDTITKTLKAKLGAAAATTNPDFVVGWADNTGTQFTEGNSNGVLNGTTAVTITTAPATATRRIVKSISIQNRDTDSVTLTVYYDDNGTQRNLAVVTLATNDTWTLTGTYDSTGALKEPSTAAVYTRDNQTGLTGTTVVLPSTPSYGLEVFKNGLLLTITDDYTVSGATVTLVTTAIAGDKFSSIYWVSSGTSTYTRDNQTGLTGTVITLPTTPTTGYELYKNGLLLTLTDDYTRTGTAVTLVTTAIAGDKFSSIYY